MKKSILFCTLLASFAFGASEPATKDDIKALREANQNDVKMLVELIKANQEATNKRFDDVNKRFDDVNKRFDDVNKRFDDVNKHFEEVNTRFEQAHNLSMAIIAGVFGLIGFSLWDRRTMMSRTKQETIAIIEKELSQKADKTVLERVVAIIEDMAKKDNEVKEILERHHLKMV